MRREREKLTYEKMFYRECTKGKFVGTIAGFPLTRGSWCKDLKTRYTTDLRRYVLSNPKEQETGRCDLRLSDDKGKLVYRPTQATSVNSVLPPSHILKRQVFSGSTLARGADINIVQYLGIAADEPERIERHTKPGVVLPLVEAGWDEAYCRKWCEDNNLLSPIYTDSTRGGCWFCHNQGLEQLRLLRKNYPDLWDLLLMWDTDSPVSFKPDGHTVHDYDLRFRLEDEGKVPKDRRFRWKMLQ